MRVKHKEQIKQKQNRNKHGKVKKKKRNNVLSPLSLLWPSEKKDKMATERGGMLG